MWVNNCIGAENCKIFHAFLTMSLVLDVWSGFLVLKYLGLSANPSPLFPLVPFLRCSLTQRPFALMILLSHVFHGVWNASLFVLQLRSVLSNLTSDEIKRWQTHKYLVGPNGRFTNPLSRGVWNNFVSYITDSGDSPYLTKVPMYDQVVVAALAKRDGTNELPGPPTTAEIICATAELVDRLSSAETQPAAAAAAGGGSAHT